MRELAMVLFVLGLLAYGVALASTGSMTAEIAHDAGVSLVSIACFVLLWRLTVPATPRDSATAHRDV